MTRNVTLALIATVVALLAGAASAQAQFAFGSSPAPAPAWIGGTLPVAVPYTNNAAPSNYDYCEYADDDYSISGGAGSSGTVDLIEDGIWDLQCYSGTDHTSATETVQVDTQTPVITVSSTAPGWTSSSAPVTVTASAQEPNQTLSGIASNVCTATNSATGATIAGSSGKVSVAGNGIWNVNCTATTGAGMSATSSDSNAVKIDTQSPLVAFSGAAASPTWYPSAQTVTVTGSEPTTVSGIASVNCSLNGALTQSATGTQMTFSVSTQGANVLVCDATTVAGITGSFSNETVQVDGSAPSVAFPNPPSSGAQEIPVRATSGGPAPVASTTCIQNGSSTTYPNFSGATTQDFDVEVTAPRSTLSCTATSAAGVAGNPAQESLATQTSTTTTQATGTQTTPTPTPPKGTKKKTMRAALNFRWTWTKRSATLRTLKLIDTLPKGTTVKVKCSGHGCPKISAAKPRKKGAAVTAAQILDTLVNHRFDVGDRVSIAFAAKGYTTETVTARIESGKIPHLSVTG